MSILSFKNRVAVITGAGAGLGRAHALLLAQRGANVVVNDPGIRDGQSTADSVVAEILATGGVAIANRMSVATSAGAESIIDAAISTFGKIDIVVNNAGVLRDKTLQNLADSDIDDVISTHLLGTIWVTRAAYRFMREQRYGRIVNTTSAAGLFGSFGQTNYAAAKMGIVGFTKALALEGEAKNIRVNAIAPVAATNMTAGLMPEGLAGSAMPERISPVVAYLAHEQCLLNGKILSVGCGRVAGVIVGAALGEKFDDLTPECLSEKIDVIAAPEQFVVPTSAYEEVALFTGAPQAQRISESIVVS